MTITQATREQTRARYPDEQGYVERDGVRVFWERYGGGEPTFLLPPTYEIVHSRSWKCQIPYRRMDYTASTPETIAEAIAKELGRWVDYRPVETDGATRAATLIAELL